MVLIQQNEGAKMILHAKLLTFREAKLKGFTVQQLAVNPIHSTNQKPK